MRRLYYSIVAFVAAVSFIALVCGDIVFKGWGFVLGDYGIQHLPWSHFYWKMLHQGELSLWTPLIQTGFPLLAEGQVGALYPLRLILFLLLPFKLAYSIEPLLHFFLGWFFTFIYLRGLSLSRTASWLGGMLFVFGSAYVGCFTNTVSMRVMIWFPALLWMITKTLQAAERMRGREVLLWLIPFSLTAYCQWTGGFIQYACYSQLMIAWYGTAMILWLYLKDRLRLFPSLGLMFWLMASLGIGMLLAAPQLLPTIELAQFSPRLGQANIDFALLGSWLPSGFLSLLIPSVSNLATPFLLYVGLAPLALAILGVRWSPSFVTRLILLSALLCIAGALGRFNPLYVWALKSIDWYGFRMPAKWLVFAAFWLSALAAIGFDMLRFRMSDERARSRMATVFGVVGLLTLLCAGVLRFLALSGGWLRKIAYWYLEHFIFGNPYHTQSHSLYKEKVENLLEVLRVATSPASNHWLFISLGIALLLILLGWSWRKGWLSHVSVQCLLILMILMDLYFFSFYGTGFKGNLAPFPQLDRRPEFFEKVSDQNAGRLFVLLEGPESYEKLKWVPNQNMSFDIAMVGAYSPLLVQSFTDYLGDLGGVDDSLGVKAGSQKSLKRGIQRLNALNATHLYSLSSLQNISGLEEIRREGEHRLYRNSGALPRAFLVPASHYFKEKGEALAYLRSSNFQPSREVVLLEHSSGVCTQSRFFERMKAVPSCPGGEASVGHLPASGRSQTRLEGAGDDKSTTLRTRPVQDSPSSGHTQAQHRASLILSDSTQREVSFREVSPTHLRAHVNTSSPSFLVVSDLFYPGWKAWIDGRSVPILQANLVMRALSLEAGDHLIEMVYQPESWKRGWQYAAFGMGSLFLVVIFCWLGGLVQCRSKNSEIRDDS